MTQLVQELQERSVQMVEFIQGPKSYHPAMQALEAYYFAGNLRHGGNPVLRMCAMNAIAIKDPAGNRKLDKSKPTGRIDGLVALAMAIGAASRALSESSSIEQGFVSL